MPPAALAIYPGGRGPREPRRRPPHPPPPGGQVAGPEGTKGRVDTLAAALTANMKVEEFQYLDLAYAPTFGTVWDPLLIAAGALLGKLGK